MNYTLIDYKLDTMNRTGRLFGFMAKEVEDVWSADENVKGIGIEEYAAVAIDENGVAKVFGRDG